MKLKHLPLKQERMNSCRFQPVCLSSMLSQAPYSKSSTRNTLSLGVVEKRRQIGARDGREVDPGVSEENSTDFYIT